MSSSMSSITSFSFHGVVAMTKLSFFIISVVVTVDLSFPELSIFFWLDHDRSDFSSNRVCRRSIPLLPIRLLQGRNSPRTKFIVSFADFPFSFSFKENDFAISFSLSLIWRCCYLAVGKQIRSIDSMAFLVYVGRLHSSGPWL